MKAAHVPIIAIIVLTACSPVLFGSTGGSQTSTFEVTYVEPTPTEPELVPFPQEARSAIEYVLAILERFIISPVPIRIEAKWRQAPGESKIAVGGPPGTFGGFPGGVPETFYPGALANALSESDVSPGAPEIIIWFRDDVPWYLGTDGGVGPDQVDFATVALHELIHGLGFLGSMRFADADPSLPACGDGMGCWGLPAGNGLVLPTIFDRFAKAYSGERLLDLPNHSAELGQALREHVVFDHEYVREAHNGEPARLWTPSSWEQDSSYSHLDPNDSGSDLLMTPAIPYGETQHHPGPLALAILETMGFKINNNDHFRSRFPLEGWSGQTSGSNHYATRQPGEPNHSTDGTIGAGSLWWQWTAPASGQLMLDTHGSDFDTRLSVYTGSDLSSLQWVASQDLVQSTEQLTFSVVGGTTYQIAVEGPIGEAGNIALQWQLKDIDIGIIARGLSDPGLLGNPFLYVVAISNASSTQVATDIPLTGLLPAGLHYVGALPNGLCLEAAQGFTCTIASLGTKKTIALEIQVLPESIGEFDVDFSVSAGRDLNPLNNTIQLTTVVLDPSLLILPFQMRLPSSNLAQSGDLFGYSVAIHGDTAVVGAPQAGAADEGRAHVFRWDGSQWTLWQGLQGGDSVRGAGFGRSVAIHGDVIAVGAPLSESGGISAGAVYLFRNEADAWIQHQKLVAGDAAQGGEFGSSISIPDNQMMIIGSPGDDDRGPGSGSAYVFERSDGVWLLQNKLTALDGTPGDRFGTSVAVDSYRAVIGAPLADGVVPSSGAAYSFVKTAVTWSAGQKFIVGAGGDKVGNSIGMSQDLLVVGLPFRDFNGGNNGVVFGYRWDGSDWVEKTQLPIQAGSVDLFGWAVDLSGSRAVIGSPLDDDRGSASGSAFIADYKDGGWVERRKLIGWYLRGGDEFGRAVAIDGTRAIVGAPSEPDPQSSQIIRTGGAYIYNTDSLSNLTISLKEPSTPDTYYKGESFLVEWTSQNSFPSDRVRIELRRDTTPRGLVQPDGLNWQVVAYGIENTGSYVVNIPSYLATAEDWRLYVISNGRDASDATGFTFSISTRPPDPPPCAVGDALCLYTVDPCRVIDTRLTSPLASGISREIPVAGLCGIPMTARAVVINVTAVSSTGPGYISLWPSDRPQPGTSVINFMAGQTRANNAVLGVASDTGTLEARSLVGGSGSVHMILDVSGYFQ